MLISKNGRLIWDEYYDNTQIYGLSSDAADKCIDPCISFDNGLTWMSLLNEAYMLRQNIKASDNASKISSSINNEGYNQLDMTFGFTPYSISEVVDIVATEIPSTSTAEYALTPFLGGTTYYFAAMNMTYDKPGFYDNSTDISGNYLYYSGNYYTGPVTGQLTTETSGDVDEDAYYPLSKIKSITLPGINTDKYKIDIFVKYPEIAKGLCIYYGTATNDIINMKLYLVTNLVQKLGANMTESSTTITLANNYPLPNKGTVIVDSEKISYTSCTHNGTNWILDGLTRYNPVEHSTATDIPIYLALYSGGIYGELPEMIYPKISVDENCIQMLNFDSKTITDLAVHGANIVNTEPVSYGTSSFEKISIPMVYSLRLTGSSVIDCNIASLQSITEGDTNYLNQINEKGSLHFFMMLSEFNDTSTVDPYVFYPLNSGEGLWMRVSRFNLKPYFGYRYYSDADSNYYDITIGSFEDYKLPSLTKGLFSSYCITWEAVNTNILDAMNNNMRFTYIVDGIEVLTFESNIKKEDFTIGNMCIGGKLNINGSAYTIDSPFIGYIDDWRLYKNIILNREDNISITRNNISQINIHSGKITLDGNEFDLNEKDIATNVDSNSLTDTGTITLKYEPRIYTEIQTFSTVGYDYGIYYDPWFINAYITDGKVKDINDYLFGGNALPYPAENISYPINANTIKVKFNLTGPVEGFTSPSIKNIMLLISEATLD